MAVKPGLHVSPAQLHEVQLARRDLRICVLASGTFAGELRVTTTSKLGAELFDPAIRN